MIEKIFETTEEKFFEVVDKVRTREMHLSKSKIVALETPTKFMRKLLEPKSVPGESMIFGSVVDCLITSPEEFDKKFKVSDITISQGNQTEVVKKCLQELQHPDNKKGAGQVFQEVFPTVYSKGKASDYLYIVEYLNAFLEGQTIITKELKEKGEAIAENLMNDLDLSFIFEQAEFQTKLDFEYNNWRFLGFTDIISDNQVVDLKFSSTFEPDRWRFEIQKWRYDVQAAIYFLGLLHQRSIETEFSFIVYDDKFEYEYVKLGNDWIDYGIATINHAIEKLEWMIRTDTWIGSYGAGKKHSRVIAAPSYLPGFEEIIS